MHAHTKKAILLVSFGTGQTDVKIRSLDAIEADLRTEFPDCPVFTAWTSRRLIDRQRREYGVHIDTIGEAMNRMLSEGISDVIVQPTFVVPGGEYDRLKISLSSFHDFFSAIRLGTPLLTDEEDCMAVAQAVLHEFAWLSEQEAMLLVGHGSSAGTSDSSDRLYPLLEQAFRQLGHPNIFVETMRTASSPDRLLVKINVLHPQHIHLAPLMITAGHHATRDLFGEHGESLMDCLSSSGYPVNPVMKGLGEYADIRKFLVQRVRMSCLAGQKKGHRTLCGSPSTLS